MFVFSFGSVQDVTRDDVNGDEQSSDWGRFTGTRLTNALIAVCFGGLMARMVWTDELTDGFSGYLFGLLYLVAGFEAIMEFAAGFSWGDPTRYVRGGILAVAVVLFYVV